MTIAAAGDPATIAALATPPGQGGIGVVRISGTRAADIAQAVLGCVPPARRAVYATFQDDAGQTIDQGLALYFPAPHSFTGESVLELHGHGGPVVMDMLLRRVCALGAHLARPGEFSERAFLNGKLDLAQAEAIADLIASSSEAAARAALRSLKGEFSTRVHAAVEQLIALRTHIEAAIDFPEEEIDFLADPQLVAQCDQLNTALDDLLAGARQGSLLRDGIRIAIVGRPNAGKSSVLNALAGYDAAIVSPTPGTTRDVIREHILIDGLPVHLLDTAGLREAADDIESEGIRRARSVIDQVDHVLVVLDDTLPDAEALAGIGNNMPAHQRHTFVRNKIDVSGRPAGTVATPLDAPYEIAVSAVTGLGLDVLRQHLKARAGFQPAGEGEFSARRRHVLALERARGCLSAARQHLDARQGELAAEELRQAQHALGEITGEFSSEDLLGRIFASFCIGK